jgi:hypothetical protein
MMGSNRNVEYGHFYGQHVSRELKGLGRILRAVSEHDTAVSQTLCCC